MDKTKLCGILFFVMLFVLPLACSKKKAPFAPSVETSLQQAETTPVSFTPTPEETVSSTPTPLASPTPTPTFQNVQICFTAGEGPGEFFVQVGGEFPITTCDNFGVTSSRCVVDQPAPQVTDPLGCGVHPMHCRVRGVRGSCTLNVNFSFVEGHAHFIREWVIPEGVASVRLDLRLEVPWDAKTKNTASVKLNEGNIIFPTGVTGFYNFQTESWSGFNFGGAKLVHGVNRLEVEHVYHAGSFPGCGSACPGVYYQLCVSYFGPPPPQVTGTVTPQATPTSTPTATPTPHFRLKLEADSTEAFPSFAPNSFSTGDFVFLKARVTDNTGNPVSGMEVEARIVQARGGGHEHSSSSRPVGFLIGSPAMTNAFGEAEIDYLAGEVSGEETVEAHLKEAPEVKDSVTIRVRVPNLVELGGGAGIALTGQTGTHPSNHYVEAGKVRETLRAAAKEYFEAYKEPMRINDISLVWGGLFDTEGNWRPPHSSHRVGRDVDIENNIVNGKNNAKKLQELNEVLSWRGWRYIPEGASFFAHFRYTGGSQ